MLSLLWVGVFLGLGGRGVKGVKVGLEDGSGGSVEGKCFVP